MSQNQSNKSKAIIVSGYFNPIHKGHLEYFNNAKALADKLFVIVNNDIYWKIHLLIVLSLGRESVFYEKSTKIERKRRRIIYLVMNKKKKIRSLNLSSEALSQNCFKKVSNVFNQKCQSKTCRFVVEMSHNLST